MTYDGCFSAACSLLAIALTQLKSMADNHKKKRHMPGYAILTYHVKPHAHAQCLNSACAGAAQCSSSSYSLRARFGVHSSPSTHFISKLPETIMLDIMYYTFLKLV